MIKMTIPEWLSKVNAAPCPCCRIGIKSKKNFVEKTLSDISLFFEEEFFREKYVNRTGFLQGINPSVKLIALLFLVVAVSISRNVYSIFAVYISALILAYISGIGLRFFTMRVWFFIPLFAGIIALPSVFSFFTPGESLVTLFYLHGIPLTITIPGVKGAIIFIMRIATSVSLVLLLMLTTRWNDLLRALASIRIPQLFILTLGMTYRYIFLLLKTMQDMHIAKKSRSIRNLENTREQKWIASSISAILRKSYMLSNDVHLAMLSRGFDGNFKYMQNNKTKVKDYVFAGFLIIAGILVMLINTNRL